MGSLFLLSEASSLCKYSVRVNLLEMRLCELCSCIGFCVVVPGFSATSKALIPKKLQLVGSVTFTFSILYIFCCQWVLLAPREWSLEELGWLAVFVWALT